MFVEHVCVEVDLGEGHVGTMVTHKLRTHILVNSLLMNLQNYINHINHMSGVV